jgi:hypothetical protein
MDRISEIAGALPKNYIVVFAVLVLILLFALYVYFFPQSIDFFTNPEQETGLKDKRVRVEPPLQ